MPEQKNIKEEMQKAPAICCDSKSMVRSIRVFAFIMIVILLLAGTRWVPEDTADLIIMLIAAYILFCSFEPAMRRNKKLYKWVIGLLALLAVLGMIVFILIK
jgi:putative copper export protein